MKKKITLGVLAIALVAILIAGGIGAWFTANADLPAAEFTAGTLEISVDKQEEFIKAMEDREIDNVNPGDCATVCWDIQNIGTKRAELRVKIDAGWVDDLLESQDQVVFFAPKPDSGWVMYEDGDGQIWLYYTRGPVAGTYGGADPTVVPLCLVVGFDGPAMGDEYQGADYKIGGEVQAVQATNGAPDDIWSDAWTAVNAEGYDGEGLANVDYFLTGNGKDMPCWNSGGGEVDPPEPELYTVDAIISPENSGSVSGTGSGLSEDEEIELTATANEGWQFDGWADIPAGANGNGNILTFNMPAADVTVKANFKAIPDTYALTLTPQIVSYEWGYGYNLFVSSYANGGGTVSGGGNYQAGEEVQLTAIPSMGFAFVGWYKTTPAPGTPFGSMGTGRLNSDLTYEYETTGEAVTIYAVFQYNYGGF